MSFVFNPLTDEQIRLLNMFDPGIYDFKVIKATEKVSQSGSSMIELQLKVKDIHGHERLMFDYLVNTEKMMFKIKHFCDAVGLDDKYLSGEFSANDCVGRIGKVEIIIQKDKTGNYPDKNAVRDYVPVLEYESSKLNPIMENKPQDNSFLNDDIPF